MNSSTMHAKSMMSVPHLDSGDKSNIEVPDISSYQPPNVRDNKMKYKSLKDFMDHEPPSRKH